MLVSAIGSYPAFRTITEESRKQPVEAPVVESVQPQIHKHKTVNPVSVTGWVGVGALATAVATGARRSSLLHKISAFVAVASVASHIGMINARNYFFKSMNTENNEG